MRCAVRFFASATVVLIVLLLVLKRHLEDVWDQYNVTAYIRSSIQETLHHATFEQSVPALGAAGDKVIIMAKLEREDTDWVADHLWDWQRAIYTVDPSNTTIGRTLTTELNKGHESMAYLTYIIDHYDFLPSTLAFLHSHRSGFFTAWHTDTPLHDNVHAMRNLQIPFVQLNGYVNLRCNWNPGCEKPHRKNKHVTREVWQEVFSDTSTSLANISTSSPSSPQDSPDPTSSSVSQTSAGDDREAAEIIKYIPNEVGAACCAQFAVSRDQVLKRPVEDYIRFRQWIIETEKSDAKSGRVMEFLWHIIFGMDAVYCPNEEVCYCQVYGRC